MLRAPLVASIVRVLLVAKFIEARYAAFVPMLPNIETFPPLIANVPVLFVDVVIGA